MKTNVHVKDEPVEYQVNKLLRLYGYNLTNQSSTKTSRTKPIINQEQERREKFEKKDFFF
jgi:hypothetical protein